MTAPSLDSISEVTSDSSSQPPMMTSWSPRSQLLESNLTSNSVRGSVTQPPSCTLHRTQLLWADEITDPPPQSKGPAWTWAHLSSGSEGSLHEVLLQGRNTSADCAALNFPPVMRMAAKIEIFIFSESTYLNVKNLTL